MTVLFVLLMVVSTFMCTKTHYIPAHCEKVSSCVCRDTDTGKLVDLRPLASHNGTARFLDVPPVGTKSNVHSYLWTKFSFNPCFHFSEEKQNTTSTCHGVAACALGKNEAGSQFIDIGMQESATFDHFDNGNLSINFASKDGKYKSILSLYCTDKDSESYLRVPGYIEENGYFWLQLWSKHCCASYDSEEGFEQPSVQDKHRKDSHVLRFLTHEPSDSSTVPLPTFPTPGSATVTMSPQPSPHQLNTLVILLFAILVVTLCILGAILGGYYYQRIHGFAISYSRVSEEPIATYSKSGVKI